MMSNVMYLTDTGSIVRAWVSEDVLSSYLVHLGDNPTVTIFEVL